LETGEESVSFKKELIDFKNHGLQHNLNSQKTGNPSSHPSKCLLSTARRSSRDHFQHI